MNDPGQIHEVLRATRDRTRLLIAGVLTGLLVTLAGVAAESFLPGRTWWLVLTLTEFSGLAAAIVVLLVLTRQLIERTADLHLALSSSDAVLWRLYPAARRVEFVAGDPNLLGLAGRRISLEMLRAVVDPRDHAGGIAVVTDALRTGMPFVFGYRAMVPSRGLRHIAVRAIPVDGAGGRRIVGVSWDETDARASALRAERTSRLYATLGALGRATRSADTLDRLYAQVCAAAAEAGGFPLVWVAGEAPASGAILPLGSAGPGVAYLDTMRVRSEPEESAGRGPVSQALRQGIPVWSNAIADDPTMAPWHEAAEQAGLRSVAAVPFRRPGGTRGVLLLYDDQAGFFSSAERALLAKIGDDLSAAAERLVVREEQRRQRELLEALVASAPVAIVSVDLDGRVGDIWNAAAEEVFGWTRDEVRGRPLPFLPPSAVEQSAEFRRRVRAGEVIRGEPVRRRRKDGAELAMLLAAAPLHDARGRVTGILGVMIDETDRVAGEERLRQSESRFRQLSEQAADVVYRYRLKPAPALEYVNPAIEQVLGYAPAELYALPNAITAILHPDEARRFLRMMARPESVEGRRIELRWRHRDGRSVWVEHRGSSVRDDRGEVVAIEGIARDVTERKRFEEELARLSRVVEQTSEAVIVTDLDGTIVYVNPAFETMSGWSRSEAVGRTPRLLKSGEQSPEFYRAMWATLTAGRAFEGRVTNRRKDGTPYLADLVISPVRDAAGKVVNFVGLQRDITRQRDLEEQLRQSQKMEALGQLTGGIAHDFNNLLTIILSNATLLVDALADRPVLQQDVQAIRAAAGRGARVVRQLMQFGRQERLNPVAVDLGALVEELAHTFRRVLPENIDTRVDIEAGLPHAMADPTAVEQMILNLATNARDAMPDGGDLRVTIRRRPGGVDDPCPEWVVVGVRDTGIGMARDVVARIFEPFYTTKPTGKGTGLGLAMVYGLMEQHGGRVTVYSEPGLGTTIRLLFPATTATAAFPVLAAPVMPLGHGERILLVEDEDGLRDVGKRILERLGYHVVSAPDGVAALGALAAGTFDLVVTDVVMPGMTGPQLARAVRARGLTMPIVFATGYAAGDVLTDIGEDALLVEKPWTLDELARAVRGALGRR